MGDPATPSEVFNDLAYEFAERLRRGEHPSITEYVQHNPDLADDIRDLFPTLVMMERVGGTRQENRRTEGASPSTATPPDRLGEFRILREIGRGGMGVVYEAEQESLGRRVALKVLSLNRHMEAVHLVRFQRESRAAARLHHTNIVPVFGVGTHEGIHYYAMQYIEGRSLDTVLAELTRQRDDGSSNLTTGDVADGDLPPRLATGLRTGQYRAPLTGASTSVEAPTEQVQVSNSSSSLSGYGGQERHYFRAVARMGLQAAEALAHAHTHGVLHRDIKPANLLLDLEGTLWVTDFGLAREEGTEELTAAGDVVGTLRYMAPERFRGKADARSDVYSLGLTLYELLTLRPAFSALDRMLLMNAILQVEPSRPRALDARIPRDLETIVLKAMAKRPSDRFAGAAEMARELDRFLAGRPIHSRRASAPERLWRWSRKNPALAVLTLLAALLTTVLAVGSTVAALTFRTQRDEKRREEQNTRIELARSLLLQSRALRHAREPGVRDAAVETLSRAAQIAQDDATPPTLLKELRDEAIAALAEGGMRPIQTWSGLDVYEHLDSFAFDVDRQVHLGKDGEIHIRRLSDQSELSVVRPKNAGQRFWPFLNPGGRFLLVSAPAGRIELWDLERSEIPSAWPVDVRCAKFRSDGLQVAVLRPDGEVDLFNLPDMTVAGRCRIPSTFPTRLNFMALSLSADGKRVAVLNQDAGKAWVHDVQTDRTLFEPKLPALRVHSTVALSPEGRLLAVSSDRSIWVYEVGTAEQLSMLQGHQASGINVLFLGTNGLLASWAWDGTVRCWDPLRGRQLMVLPGNFWGWTKSNRDPVAGFPNSLTRYRIGSGDGYRYIDCRALADPPTDQHFGPARVSFSPDSRFVALPMRPDGVLIVRASDGSQVARLPIGVCDEAVFLPDGSLVTYNFLGLCHWRFRPGENGEGTIGPPMLLAPFLGNSGNIPTGLDSDSKGRFLALSAKGYQATLLLDPGRPWSSTWLGPHNDVGYLDVSRDGRWVATSGVESTRKETTVRIWDVNRNRLVHEFPVVNSRADFSPDGRLIAMTGASHIRFYRTSDWTLATEIPHGGNTGFKMVEFHPSGKLVAINEATRSVVRLADVDTGEILATLEGPDDVSPYSTSFSPDGRLLAVSYSNQKVALWDLARIRQRLVGLNLARGFPDLFESHDDDDELESTPGPVTVMGVDDKGLLRLSGFEALLEASYAFRGMLRSKMTDPDQLYRRARIWAKIGLWPLAAADYKASLRERPDWGLPANELAWCLALRPGRGDPAEAVRWARWALAIMSNKQNVRNTLALSLYRVGEYQESVKLSELNIKERGPDVFDLLVLAMCQHRLGRIELARATLARAEQWRAQARITDAGESYEIDGLFAEARNLFGTNLPNLPSNPFAR